MTRRKEREEVEKRLEEVRRLLRERHAGIEPDAAFVHRVLDRLPPEAAWSIDWAAWRILPVSLLLAAMLVVAVVTTNRSTGETVTPVAVSASSETPSDVLEWLLEGRGEKR